MAYINILLVALITIFVVDLSGFTTSWRGWLADRLHIRNLKPLPPFDCGLCMTWWVCIAYTICSGTFCLGTLAFVALIAYLSIPLGQLIIFIKEGLISLTNKLIELCSRQN